MNRGTKRPADNDTEELPPPDDHDERALDPTLAENPEDSDDEMLRPAKKYKKYVPAYPNPEMRDMNPNLPMPNDFNPSGKLPNGPTPTETLCNAVKDQAPPKHNEGENIVYWMRMHDLRVEDNHALSKASWIAMKRRSCLIVLHVLSPHDYMMHGRSARQIDFVLRNIRELQKVFERKLRIPFYIITHKPRAEIPNKVLDLCKQWNASYLIGSIEHEVDELWRDIKVVEEAQKVGVYADFVDNNYVIPPGSVTTKGGRPFSVFSPWLRAWKDFMFDPKNSTIMEEPTTVMENIDDIVKKDSVVSKLFRSKILPYVPGFKCEERDAERMKLLWPAGSKAAHQVLDNFVRGLGGQDILEAPATAFCNNISGKQDTRLLLYHTHRDIMSENSTSRISPYLSIGAISARACLRRIWDATRVKDQLPRFDCNTGANAYGREIAFRDFYGHMLAAWPRVCMGRAFKTKYEGVIWENDEETFAAWKEGRTGYPIVDASMRQALAQGYMHNRGRMIVAMFLTKYLMHDWRKGEAWFMEQFIDGDFASNNGGWQWCASTGTDAVPYFRIFSPLAQSEKCDPEGRFIRHWVPELKNVQGRAIHAPFDFLPKPEFEKLDYPEPIVDYKFARERALRRFKNIGER